MDITAFKWLSAVIIFVTTVIGPIFSIFFTSSPWTSRLEMLAGGVFLGAGLVHLMGDSYEQLYGKMKYPLGPAVTAIVFTLLSLVQLMSYSEHDDNLISDDPDEAQKQDIEQGTQETKDAVSPRSPFGDGTRKLTVPIIVLYIIMDVHSAIEGLALGILSKWSSIIAIFCAIVGHKPLEAFSLGLMVMKGKPTKLVYASTMIFYTLLSPIGVMVAIYLTSISSPIALGVIAAFSAGTFIYVGCDQWTEFSAHRKDWTKEQKRSHYLFYAGGVAWMLLIAIVEALE